MEEIQPRIYDLWEALAGVKGGLRDAKPTNIVVSPQSQLSRAGWVGIVQIGEAVLITAPDERQGALLRSALFGIDGDSLFGDGFLSRVLPIEDLRGPATLAYLRPADFRAQRASLVEELVAGDPALTRLSGQVTQADSDESSITEITSPAFSVALATSFQLLATGPGSDPWHTFPS